MSELTAYQSPAQVVDHRSRAVTQLAEWATAAEGAFKVAQRLVETSFVPVAFRGKPMEATAAILAGAEVGLSPMSALKAFDIIQGQAAPRAITLRAIAQSYGHDIELVESTASRCRVRARRKGGDWQSITWTMDRATALGLASKDGWRKQPQAMLVARATSEAARLVAADAILGIGYSAEEIADGVTVPEATDIDPAPEQGARRMSRRKPDPAPDPEPPIEEGPEPSDPTDWPAVAAPEPDPITPAQLKMLHVVLGKAGATDRDAGLALISGIVGRPVESSKDLTKHEASKVIDALSDGDA